MIARLLDSGPQVLATGGGAFMNPNTRDADPRERRLGLAEGRFRRADAARQAAHRPAAAADRRSGGDAAPDRERYPVYAQADITVQSRDVPHDAIVDEIMSPRLPKPLGVAASAEQTP